MPFKPNALFYVEHPGDTRRLLINLAEAISHDIPMPYADMREIYAKANVGGTVPEALIKRRLRPFANEIFAWLYRRIVNDCNVNHIKPIFVSLPTLNPDSEPANIPLAKAAGFEIVDLTGVYDGHTWWDLCVSNWDPHPSAEGHRLIADKLYSELLKTGAIPMKEDAQISPATQADTANAQPR
jgi:hypothetical protein